MDREPGHVGTGDIGEVVGAFRIEKRRSFRFSRATDGRASRSRSVR